MICSVFRVLPSPLVVSLFVVHLGRMAFISEVRHTISAALFENAMLAMWTHIGSVRTLASHLSMRCGAYSHPEAGWQSHAQMPDYPVLYFTPISVHMAYGYLSCCEFSSNMFTFQQHHFVRSPSSLLGATWLEGGSRYQLRTRAVVIWVFTLFQPS